MGLEVDLWILHVSVHAVPANKVGQKRAGPSVDNVVNRARVIANLQALIVRSCNACRGTLRGHGGANKAYQSD